jgi:glycosyltransferase involved in cell wall biosynthesis
LMRVALDATVLSLTSGGLARYTAELHSALQREFPSDEYLLFRPSGPKWWSFGVSKRIHSLGVDLFHGTNFEVPYLPSRPSVLTLHDLSPWMDPAWHSGADRVRQRARFLLGLGMTTMVITPSAAVRRQAIERFRIHPERIAAVPEAADDRFHQATRRPGEKPYFLFVGTLEPRKNLRFLVDAWRPVHQRHGVELVLAGRRRDDCPPIPEESGLHFTGEVNEADLPGWYAGALAFAYPSLYEGFGLPVLEAMRAGCCVLASTDEAIGEVCDGAALRIDARDSAAWTAAMMRCAEGGDWMSLLKEKARARAMEFSWAKTARLTRAVYEEALERFPR